MVAWVAGSKFSFDVVGPYIEKHNEGDISSFSAGGIAATDEAASKSKDRLDAVLVASDTTALPEKISADAGKLSYLISCSLKKHSVLLCLAFNDQLFCSLWPHHLDVFDTVVSSGVPGVFLSLFPTLTGENYCILLA